MPFTSLKLIPKRTVIVHLSWLGALFFFVLIAIFPLQKSRTGLDEEIKNTQHRIEEQKNLKPIYQALKAKSLAPTERVLPTPIKVKLSRTMVGTVPSTVTKMARNSAMEAVSVSPDINSLLGNSEYLLVQAVLRGNFMNFRNFLISIGELPYLERIEAIEILQDPDFMEFRIKFRVTVG